MLNKVKDGVEETENWCRSANKAIWLMSHRSICSTRHYEQEHDENV